MGKRVIDVEDAVRWACADELPKKRAGDGPRPPALQDLVAPSDGLFVGRWTRPPSFPAVHPMFARGYSHGTGAGRGGPPHSDALIVEAAIAEVAAAGLGQFAAGALEAAIAGDIGVPVDAAGALAAARANIGNLILVHGRLGSRPDPGDARWEVRPRLAPNGKPGVWRTERLTDPLGGERDYETPTKAIRKDLYLPWS